MTKRLPSLVFAATLLLFGVTPAAAQQCSIVRVDQENYLALSELAYIYVPSVNKSAAGWNSFTARVLVGEYRRPLLLKQGFMREADVNQLLSGRRDITQYPLEVVGSSPRMPPGTKAGQAVSFNDNGQRRTIRVIEVVLAAGPGVNSNQVRLEVCAEDVGRPLAQASPGLAVQEGLAAWRRYATTEDFGSRWGAALMAAAEYRIERVEPGVCSASSGSNDSPTVSCLVAVEKAAREDGDLALQWTYKDHYTQVIRFTLANRTWVPGTPSIDLDKKREREGYQQEIRQALGKWMSELTSGDLSRMRRASPALEDGIKSEGKVSRATCRVAASPPPVNARCSIAWHGTGPIPKGVKNPVFYLDALQTSITQELAIEQTQGGSLAATPVRATRR